MKRRILLRGLGGAVVALPILSSLRTASAQVSSRRLLTFFSPNGVNMPTFCPEFGSGGAMSQSSFSGRGTEALSPFRDKLLVPRGIHMTPQGFANDAQNPGCDHRKGTSCKLTAAPLQETGQNYASAHSYDFEAARRINAGGANPLVLKVGRTLTASSGSATSFISYSGAGEPYPGENNPWNVYRTMMNIMPGTQAEDEIARRRRSIADLIRDDLDSVRRLPMSSDDRAKIDSWLALVRDTEVGMMSGAGCSAETPNQLGISGVERFDGMNNDQVGSDSEYREAGRLLVQVAALAMVCDHNRVITIQWSNGSGGPTFDWDNISHSNNHHQLSHWNTRDDDSGDPIPEADARRWLHEIDSWYAERFAELLTLLEMFPEGAAGQTMLDQSAAMWINELSDGKAHHFMDLPVIIAGSAGGYLRQGATVDCTTRPHSGDFMPWPFEGSPHNKLLTTLLRAVGAYSPTESFNRTPGHGEDGEFDLLKA